MDACCRGASFAVAAERACGCATRRSIGISSRITNARKPRCATPASSANPYADGQSTRRSAPCCADSVRAASLLCADMIFGKDSGRVEGWRAGLPPRSSASRNSSMRGWPPTSRSSTASSPPLAASAGSRSSSLQVSARAERTDRNAVQPGLAVGNGNGSPAIVMPSPPGALSPAH